VSSGFIFKNRLRNTDKWTKGPPSRFFPVSFTFLGVLRDYFLLRSVLQRGHCSWVRFEPAPPLLSSIRSGSFLAKRRSVFFFNKDLLPFFRDKRHLSDPSLFYPNLGTANSNGSVPPLTLTVDPRQQGRGCFPLCRFCDVGRPPLKGDRPFFFFFFRPPRDLPPFLLKFRLCISFFSAIRPLGNVCFGFSRRNPRSSRCAPICLRPQEATPCPPVLPPSPCFYTSPPSSNRPACPPPGVREQSRPLLISGPDLARFFFVLGPR